MLISPELAIFVVTSSGSQSVRVSSRVRVPASTNFNIVAAVKVLVMLPISKRSFVVTGILFSIFAIPAASDQFPKGDAIAIVAPGISAVTFSFKAAFNWD